LQHVEPQQKVPVAQQKVAPVAKSEQQLLPAGQQTAPRGPLQQNVPAAQQMLVLVNWSKQQLEPDEQQVTPPFGPPQQVTGPGPGQQVTVPDGKKLAHSLLVSLPHSLHVCMHCACEAPWKLAQ
jgi:hypothetical protein